MACGCAADARWLATKNLTLGVEGPNGMASVGGPNPPAMGVFDYYWHGSTTGIGVWGRIVSGTDQGLDNDITPSSNTNPFHNFEGLCNKIYIQAKVNAMRLTDPELLSGGKFASGGDMAGNWSYGGDTAFQYLKSFDGGKGVFVPVVRLAAESQDKSKTAPTELHPSEAHIYQEHKGNTQEVQQTWTLPLSWVGKNLSVATITPSGKQPGVPTFEVNGRLLSISVAAGRPIAISSSQ